MIQEISGFPEKSNGCYVQFVLWQWAAMDWILGPGTGTFLLILYTGVAKLPVAKATGTMKLANLSSNVMALAVFLFSGKIIVLLGLAASVFSIAGHYVGSGMVMKNGNKIVRPIILIVLALLFIKIITGM